MNSARRVQIPEGREAETHSEDVIFKKVAREPNRFESVFFGQTAKTQAIQGFNAVWGANQNGRSTQNR
jgi:hypothetical protein